MAKQKHDIGWKKRQPREQKAKIPTEIFARKLVRKGLASPSILTRPYKHNQERP